MAFNHNRRSNLSQAVMKWISCIAAGLLLAAGGCSNPQAIHQSAESGPGVVDVMTFNIRNGNAKDGENHWTHRKNMVADVISGHGADIVGLQEAFDFQAEYIADAMGQYGIYYVGRDDGVKAGESCAVLYLRNRYKLTDSGTFWFSDTPEKPSANWGNKYLRICSWVRLVDKSDGKGLYVYNLHLDHISQNSREKSTQLLARRISLRKEKDPYIVMGDFNMPLDNPGMRFLQKVGFDTPYPPLVSAWASMYPEKAGMVRTGHGFKGGRSGAAIDHILVEEGTKVLKADIDQRAINGRYPSDHYPVTARVKLY